MTIIIIIIIVVVIYYYLVAYITIFFGMAGLSSECDM